MQLSRKAVETFLARPRKDYRTYKDLPDAELERMMLALPVRPPIWKRLSRAQKIMFLIGAQTKAFSMHADTGTGKTLLSIALALYFRKLGVAHKILVLVPNRINKTEWALEVYKHTKTCGVTVLDGSSENKWNQLAESTALLVVETYAGLVRLVSDVVPSKRKKKDNQLEPNPKLVTQFCDQFDGVVFDESTNVKNHQTLSFRICRQLSKRVDMRLGLSGMPFGRDPGDLWAQLFLIDHGETLGETLGLYRSVFFQTSINFWGGYEHRFDKKKDALLHRVLANRSIRFEAEGLPKVWPVIKKVILPEDANSYYDAAKKAIQAAKGNRLEIQRSFIRMRQISSGFLGYTDDETGERAQFVFPENPKLEMLLSIIESIRDDRKIVVFYDFTFSGKLIAERVHKELGIKTLHLYGGTEDIDKLRYQFDHDPKQRVLVMQNRFGFGPNLQAAQYFCFYESPVSVIVRKQCERRVERQHSAFSTVFRYDLVTQGTADERILEFHKSGADLFKALIDGKLKM